MSKIDFQEAAVVAILDFSIGSFSYFVSHKRVMLIIKFRLNWIIEEMSKI